MKKRIAFAVAVLGFIFLLGTVGASDTDLITLEQTAWRCTVFLAMMVGGGYASYIFEQMERG